MQHPPRPSIITIRVSTIVISKYLGAHRCKVCQYPSWKVEVSVNRDSGTAAGGSRNHWLSTPSTCPFFESLCAKQTPSWYDLDLLGVTCHIQCIRIPGGSFLSQVHQLGNVVQFTEKIRPAQEANVRGTRTCGKKIRFPYHILAPQT
jgi:hypothetical protein